MLRFSIIALVACGSASPRPAAPPPPQARACSAAEPEDGGVSLLSVSVQGTSASKFSDAQSEGLRIAVRDCWRDAQKPGAAGLMRIELTDIAADGSFHVGGYSNWAHADVFDDCFVGNLDSSISNLMAPCVQQWLGMQSYPGVTRVEAILRLLPVSARP